MNDHPVCTNSILSARLRLPAPSIVGLALSIIGSGLAAGCADPEPQDGAPVKTAVTALAHAQVTGSRPEIGYLNFPGGSCSATLIAPQWVLTAAHCVNFSTDSRGYFFRLGTADGGLETTQHLIDGIINLGPPGPVVGDLNDWAQAHLTIAADSSGTNDIALLFLHYPIAGVTPAPIATSLPVLGSPPGLASDPGTATQFGYGCTLTPVDDGKKRFVEWRYVAPGGNLMYTPFRLIDADGVISPNTQLIPVADYSDGGNACSGDSGGPVVLGRLTDNGVGVAVDGAPVTLGAVWGVNSTGNGHIDTFGAVAFLHKPLCQAIYSWEPQKWCAPSDSGPFFVPPVGCASSQSDEDAQYQTDFVISSVCAADPYCCQVDWNSTCVDEGRALFHSVNEVGGPLTVCDPCAAQVCSFDSYCCSPGDAWDSQCVDEASSTCEE